MKYFDTHFLSLNMKLNMRQMTASAMPTVDNTMKITVRAVFTVTIISLGFPSYGVPSKEQEMI